MDSQSPDKLKPALIGGVALGLASSIPFLNCCNCFCCLLVIFGGVLAGWLYIQDAAPSHDPRLGEGALVGAGAGIVGAVVASFVGAFFQLLMNRTGFSDPEATMQAIEQALAEAGVESTAALERFMEGAFSGAVSFTTILLNLLFYMVIFPLFGALGGLLAASLFHKKATVTAPPVVPQPPSNMPPPPTV